MPPAVHAISQINSLPLPSGGYRHDLVHLTGDYYISLHTVTESVIETSPWSYHTTLRLYTITDGQISLIGSDTINTVVGPTRAHPTPELNSHPRSAALVRVDDDTIAVSYVSPPENDDFASTVATFDVVYYSPYFIESESVNFQTGGETDDHSLITFDANTLVIAYSHPASSSDGFIQDINIGSDGALSAGTAETVTTAQGRYPSVVKLDVDTVVVAYRNGTAVGAIQAFDVSPGSTEVFDAGTALLHDAGRTAYASLVKVDDTTVALAYSEIGVNTNTGDGSGRIKIFDVATDNTVTQRGDTIIYYNDAATAAYEERVHLNSLVMLDSNTLALAYRGVDADGFIRTYDITPDGLVATSEPFEHDDTIGAFNSLVRIDDITLALAYGGDLPQQIANTGTPNRIKTIAAIDVATDTTVPTITSFATPDDTTIILLANEYLAGTVDAARVTVPGNVVSVDPVISGLEIIITVDMPLVDGAIVTVGYNGDTISDVVGNALGTFTLQSVTVDIPGPTSHNIFEIDSVLLPDNGYRHNLLHLTGDYYVSSHTIPKSSGDSTRWNYLTVLGLYSITDGRITQIANQTIGSAPLSKQDYINYRN